MAKFCKRPDIVDAVQWLGNNFNEISDLHPLILGPFGEDRHLEISTNGGGYVVNIGDWIIVDNYGYAFPTSSFVFDEMYELVE